MCETVSHLSGYPAWFHGAIKSDTANTRLKKDGSFLVSVDEFDQNIYHIFLKWNGQCHRADVFYDTVQKTFTLGSSSFDTLENVIDFFQSNKIPVIKGMDAVIAHPILATEFIPSDNAQDFSKLTKQSIKGADSSCSHKKIDVSNDQTNGDIGHYFSKLPSGSKINRQQIHYLTMDDKPFTYRTAQVNRSLRSKNLSYCDPSSLHTSTVRPPTPSTSNSSYASQHTLFKLCQGFINYDLSLAFVSFCEVTKPLDSRVFHAVAKILLGNGAEAVADAISIETCTILTLNWLPQATESSSLPPNGYSLLLWPGATGFRGALFNRNRFLSHFVTASIIALKEADVRPKMLSMWMDVVKRLIGFHKDFYSSEAIVNGIRVEQILNNKDLWERAFPCVGSPEAIDKLKGILFEQRHDSAVDSAVAGLSNVASCIPSIGALVEELFRLQSTAVDSGCLPSPQLIQRLMLVKIASRKGMNNSSGEKNLWVNDRWRKLQVAKIPTDLRCVFKTENLLLMLLGPADVSNTAELDECSQKLEQILLLLSDL